MGLQRVGHDGATEEQQQKDLRFLKTHRQTKLSPTVMDKRKGHGWRDDVYRSWVQQVGFSSEAIPSNRKKGLYILPPLS